MEGTSNNGEQNLTRGDIESLLRYDIKTDGAFYPKVKFYIWLWLITRLKKSVRRYQEFEGELLSEHEKLKKSAENDARISAALKEDLEKALRESNEKIKSINDMNKVLQEDNTTLKGNLEESMKQKEALSIEVGRLKGDLHQVREDRDRQLSLVTDLTAEVLQYKECTGGVSSNLIQLEATCTSQSDTIRTLQEQLATAEQKLEISLETSMKYANQERLNTELQNRVREAELKVVEGEALRKKLHDTILELKGNIRVFCRVRPPLSGECVDHETKTISFPTTTATLGRGVEIVHNGSCNLFMFDKVFTPQASQEEVFVEISQLVQSAVDGYKVCIFAYGQTGSGKTHTMMGTPDSHDKKGLIPRSLEQIFASQEKLLEQGWKYKMQVSMLEIYNESIHDLLSSSKKGNEHAIKHDAKGNLYVSNLTIMDAQSSHEVLSLLNQAAQRRSVGKTKMNEGSSRSHFVLTLRISGAKEGMEEHVQGVLNLIDLAGSERLPKSGATEGGRQKETMAINKSLSALGDVIAALGKKGKHIPYRNSKLTYMLQPYLGGDSKTLMVVNLSPASLSAQESICSLRFAEKVNACEISVPRRQPSTSHG